MATHESDGSTALAAVRKSLTLRSRPLRVVVVSTLGIVILVLLLLAPILQEVETLAGVAVGVATAVFLLGILLDHGAEVEGELESLTRRVGDVRDRLEAQENQLIRIDAHVAEVALEERLEVFGNEEDAMPRQLEFIEAKNLQFVRLCEYSTGSIQRLLTSLADHEDLESIELLMGSPAKASPFQLEFRLKPALVRLAHMFPEPHAEVRGLKIKCYSEAPSMRGRNFSDELIVMGWYTHHCKEQRWGRQQIWGDENSLIWTPCRTPQGKRMRDMFEEVFKALWGTAEPLTAAWAPFQDEFPEFPENDWLETVSS